MAYRPVVAYYYSEQETLNVSGASGSLLPVILPDKARADKPPMAPTVYRVCDRIGVGHFSEHRAQARWHADAGAPQAGACGSDSAYPSRRKCHGPLYICEVQRFPLRVVCQLGGFALTAPVQITTGDRQRQAERDPTVPVRLDRQTSAVRADEGTTY